MRLNKSPFATLGFLLLTFAWMLPADGQEIVWKAGQKQFPKAAQSDDPVAVQAESPESTEQEFHLYPMAEPSPALKHRFWVSPSLRRHGNVNPYLSRAMVLYLSHPSRETLDQQYNKSYERWVEQKVRDEALSAHVIQQREILDTIYEAADMETIELHSTQRNKRGRDVLTASFSEIQNLRSLARLVQLDGLLAIKERRHDHAIQAIGAGFRLAEFAQSSGDANLLNGLVSVAISGISFSMIEELSQQADAPNLYWALASLPDVLWDQRGWIDGESVSMSRILFPLLEPVTTTMTPSEWTNQLVRSVEVPMELGNISSTDTSSSANNELSASVHASAQLVVGAALLAFGDRARTELVESGIAAEQVQMSASEAVARSTKIRFERTRDNLFKWSLLQSRAKPYSEVEWKNFQDQMGSDFAEPGIVLIGLLVPALQAADSAALRCNLTHKQLMLHEALRAHAATHDGNLPESLVALQPLPVLPNPESGEMFQYERMSVTEAVVRRNPTYPNEKVVTRIVLQVKK